MSKFVRENAVEVLRSFFLLPLDLRYHHLRNTSGTTIIRVHSGGGNGSIPISVPYLHAVGQIMVHSPSGIVSSPKDNKFL